MIKIYTGLPHRGYAEVSIDTTIISSVPNPEYAMMALREAANYFGAHDFTYVQISATLPPWLVVKWFDEDGRQLTSVLDRLVLLYEQQQVFIEGVIDDNRVWTLMCTLEHLYGLE